MNLHPSPAWSVSAGALVFGVTGYVAARLWAARERQAIGYVAGRPVTLTVIGIDGKPVEVGTAAAYRRMRDAATADGIKLRVVSGFRTMAEQEYLYGCYQSGRCNNGNLAEPPGYSNHQSGHALDLNARDPAVGAWLRAHAAEYGFQTTVPSEPWHWEFWP